MTVPVKKPYVLLRCKKCSRKTNHVMLNTSLLFRFGECQLEETFECQECGEIKKIYEFTTRDAFIPKLHSVEQRSKSPQRERKIPEKVKEKDKEKDFMEVTIRKKKK